MVIAIDFDGTCVSHEFPKVGKDIGAVPVLKKLVERGHKLILHTMRGDGQSFYCGELCKMEDVKNKVNPVAMSVLDDAVKWFFDNNIPLYGINNNPQQKHWTDSKKVFAHMYIDDSALGIPLKYDEDGSVHRPYVDWIRVEQLLKEKGLINDDYKPNDRRMEDWEVTIDDECLSLSSRNHERYGIMYHLDSYNAYDDNGNKIDGGYVVLIKKEYDNGI